MSRGLSACTLASGVHEKHGAAYKSTQRKLLIALVIAFLFMIVEVVGGIYAGSLAIINDAAHLLSDVSGFGVSALAAVWAARVSGSHFSYGYHRVEVLGALASVLTVWLVTGVLLVEAVQRIINPEPVNGKIMFVLALTGVVVNIVLLLVLGGHHHHGHDHGGHDHGHDHGHGHAHDHAHNHSHDHAHDHGHNHAHNHEHDHDEVPELGAERTTRAASLKKAHNINMVGAVIHVIGDLVQSIGVAVAGLLIWMHEDDPRWTIADPICTFFFAALVLWTTKRLIRDIADVLMERVPRGLDIADIHDDLAGAPGVDAVSDLHVWSLTPGIPLLCAHISLSGDVPAETVVRGLTAYIRSLGITHSTLQTHGDAPTHPDVAPH